MSLDSVLLGILTRYQPLPLLTASLLTIELNMFHPPRIHQVTSILEDPQAVAEHKEMLRPEIPETVEMSKHDVGWRKIVRNFTPA